MKTVTWASAIAAAATLLLSPAAIAQSAITSGWSGEGNVSAGLTTGNTETTDLAAGLKLERDLGAWKFKGALNAEYGETDSAQTRNRWGLAAQADRDLSERYYAYGRGSFEQDEFSAFDSRAFLGVGAGVHLIKGDATSWSVEAGPGFRWDELSNGVKEESVAFRGASAFKHAFNEAVTLSNDTEITYAEVSTQVINALALTAKLSEALAARVSFEVRHDTDVLPGREKTDTATRFSLVYGF
ncbi:DUF481 domain-containing protein [bacterium]|nr:DUF481 domain-containing protein [bacterium]